MSGNGVQGTTVSNGAERSAQIRDQSLCPTIDDGELGTSIESSGDGASAWMEMGREKESARESFIRKQDKLGPSDTKEQRGPAFAHGAERSGLYGYDTHTHTHTHMSREERRGRV